jgi:inosine-uridine nucleoside N-ribohydrolase
MAMKKLIIDCDAGVDDSMATILMALSAHKKEEVEVLAITATAGNAALENV